MVHNSRCCTGTAASSTCVFWKVRAPGLTDLDRDTSPELLYERRDGVRALVEWDGSELVEWDIDGQEPQSESTQRLLREARRVANP